MNDKPKFGLDAQKEETPDQQTMAKPSGETAHDGQGPKFGAAAMAHTTSDTPRSVWAWVKHIFAMQPTSFWLKQYGYGILAWALCNALGWPFALGLINFVLYPFTVTILQEIGRNRAHNGTISAFFFGFSVGMIGESFWWIAIYGVIRLIIFLFKFMFSFLIGTIGLIYMVSQAKKLN